MSLFFPEDRESMRQLFFESWQRYQKNQTLSPLQQQIAQIIALHPEYHRFFDQQANQTRNFWPEQGQTNPFLHLGLHISLIEQIYTDRPKGIRAVFDQLMQQYDHDEHQVHHQMMDPLAEMLWQQQRDPSQISDTIRQEKYLAALQQLVIQ